MKINESEENNYSDGKCKEREADNGVGVRGRMWRLGEREVECVMKRV